jgi:putative peptidoglycan lipid II flippase
VTLKHVSIVTVLTGANLLMTLINQIVLAYLFGAGASMDAFLACGAVPFVVLSLAIGDLGYVLVPLLMECEQHGTLDEAINSSFTSVTLLALGVTVTGISCHRGILQLTTASNMPSATFGLANSMAPLMWLIIGLTIMGSYLTGVQYFRRQFALPSVTLAVPYLGMIVGGLVGAHRLGIISVALGWTIGTFMRDVILLVTLQGSPVRFSRNLLHPATRKLIRSLPVLGLSLLPFAALPMIDVYWASRLPVGSISYLGYSNRIVIALTSIVVQGLSVVMFPDLSEDIAKGKTEVFQRKVIDAMKVIFLVIVPLAVLVVIARIPMIQFALQRGKFTADSVMGVAKVLPFYLLGVVWMAMMNIVIRGFYAIQDYLTPAKLGAGALVLYTAVSGLLIPHYSYLAIGIAYCVFWLFMFVIQAHFLGKAVGILLNRNFLAFLGKVLASSVAAILFAFVLRREVTVNATIAGAAVVQGTGGMLLFVAVSHYVFKLPQYPLLFEVIQQRFRVASGTE